MKLPLQITFRNTDRSEALDAHIQKKADKLDQICDDIISCRVMVEARHRHHHKGNLYHARIDLTVPEREIVVSRDPQDNRAHEDAYVAIRDAFEAARRQLEAHMRKRRGEVKHHEERQRQPEADADLDAEFDLDELPSSTGPRGPARTGGLGLGAASGG
jgi:ribosomal subunit interface protein